MPPITPLSEDDYNSSEDSDFAPEKIDINYNDASSDSDSDSDSDSENGPTKKRKRLSNTQTACLDIYDSGDEKIISILKQEKNTAKDVRQHDFSGDGAERVVKTRSQRSKEDKVNKKQTIDESAITIDVDAVWEAMKLGKPLPNSNETSPTKSQSHLKDNLHDTSQQIQDLSSIQAQASSCGKTNDEGPDSMIKIKRIYKFAGKFHTEEKIVARGSAEAKLYLKSLSDTSEANVVESESSDNILKFKRPPKLARTSIFEPVSQKIPKRSDLNLGVRRETSLLASDILKDGKKLNTVEKSAMDWASFVDQEGIADELDAASKSKNAYKARQEFLARVEQKKENNARKAIGFIS